jgi:SAM-dependent methyltransferase
VRPSLEFFLKNYLKGDPPSVDDSIHPKDEMYLISRDRLGPDKAQMMYFKLGKDLSRTIAQIVDWRFTARRSSIRVMEFACGYGRNVRYLVHMFPKENIFVSDIYRDAVSFNREQFGVRGRVSVHDPDQLRWNERFDLILVPSLFSHLPESTFSRWIAALFGLLSDDGLLVFSVHGDHLLPSGFEMPQSGIYFYKESESATLHKWEYGTSHVTEGFVREQIRRATGRDRCAMTHRGFWNFHDFYMVSKNDDVDVSTFQYDYGIIGYLDSVVVTLAGALNLNG